MDPKNYQIKPNKALGQYFLQDKAVLGKIITAADIKPDDIVLEIGPGLGVLTRELAKKAKKVIAIEKDAKMCEALEELLESWNVKNVELVQGDILKIKPETYTLNPNVYKVVANLPYYISSPVIRKLLESETQPKEMVLMVQKEVGERICAKPPDMSLLSVAVQFYARPEIIAFVPKTSFWPKPEVDSAIIKIAPLINADRKLINTDLFFRVVKAGFSQKRKQLINNLSNNLELTRAEVVSWLSENNINPTQRAQTLSVQDWINLAKSFKINQ